MYIKAHTGREIVKNDLLTILICWVNANYRNPTGYPQRSRDFKSSVASYPRDSRGHPRRTGGRPVPRTRRGSEAPDDRRQGSGGKKAMGERDAAKRGGPQLGRLGPHVISIGTGLFADVRGPRDRRWTRGKMSLNLMKRSGLSNPWYSVSNRWQLVVHASPGWLGRPRLAQATTPSRTRPNCFQPIGPG
jgi:hypothetical protein